MRGLDFVKSLCSSFLTLSLITASMEDNGIYTVATSDKCTMYGPSNIPRLMDSLPGYNYLFVVQIGTFGNLSTTTQTSQGSIATWKRTSGTELLSLRHQTSLH